MPGQLHMVWPEDQWNRLPPIQLPSEYELRLYRHGDEADYLTLMHRAGFQDWTPDMVTTWVDKPLPNGLFFVVHAPSQQIVATAMATHNPTALHPNGGELGWVAGDPDHAGKRLGAAVCWAVMRRYREAGYGHVYLKTDDWRLPAIKVYLKMGFAPLMHEPDMEERWRAICARLQWPI